MSFITSKTWLKKRDRKGGGGGGTGAPLFSFTTIIQVVSSTIKVCVYIYRGVYVLVMYTRTTVRVQHVKFYKVCRYYQVYTS